MVYVGMNVLEEEAAARIWRPAGAGNGAEHQLIRQSACWLVALATLSTLDQKARRTSAEYDCLPPPLAGREEASWVLVFAGG